LNIVSPATPWWTWVLKVHVAMEGVISDVGGGGGDDPRVDLSEPTASAAKKKSLCSDSQFIRLLE
jgi:hypothetical protein